jgi:hypothetical protein
MSLKSKMLLKSKCDKVRLLSSYHGIISTELFSFSRYVPGGWQIGVGQVIENHSLKSDLNLDARRVLVGHEHGIVDQTELSQDLSSLVSQLIRREPDKLNLVFGKLDLQVAIIFGIILV